MPGQSLQLNSSALILLYEFFLSLQALAMHQNTSSLQPVPKNGNSADSTVLPFPPSQANEKQIAAKKLPRLQSCCNDIENNCFFLPSFLPKSLNYTALPPSESAPLNTVRKNGIHIFLQKEVHISAECKSSSAFSFFRQLD